MKMYRKLLAVLTAASMMLTMIPAAAFAGDMEDVYIEAADDAALLDGEGEEFSEAFPEEASVVPSEETYDELETYDEFEAYEEYEESEEYAEEMIEEVALPEAEVREDFDEYLSDDGDEVLTEESALDAASEEDGSDAGSDTGSDAEMTDEEAVWIADDESDSMVEVVEEAAHAEIDMELRTEYGPYQLGYEESVAFTFTPSETGTYLLRTRLNEHLTLHYAVLDETGMDMFAGYGADNPIKRAVKMTEGVTYTIILSNSSYEYETVPVLVSIHKMEHVILDASGQLLFIKYVDGKEVTASNIGAYFCPTTEAPLYTGDFMIRTNDILYDSNQTPIRFQGWQDSNGNEIRNDNFMSVGVLSTLTALWSDQIRVTLNTTGETIRDIDTYDELDSETTIWLDKGTTLRELNRRFKAEGDNKHRFIKWVGQNNDVDESCELIDGLVYGSYFDDTDSEEIDQYSSVDFNLSESDELKRFHFIVPEDGYYTFKCEYQGSDSPYGFLLEVRDQIDQSMLEDDDLAAFKYDYETRSQTAQKTGYLRAGRPIQINILNTYQRSPDGTFILSIRKRFYVNASANNGMIELNGNVAGSSAVVFLPEETTIEDLTNACRVTRAIGEEFLGWAASSNDAEPLESYYPLELGATYYALFKDIEVSDLPKFRQWNQVGNGSQTTVVYRYTVPKEPVNSKPIAVLTQGDAYIHLELFGEKENLLAESYGYNIYRYLPTYPGATYYVRLSGSATDMANVEFCAAEMNAVTLEAEDPIFVGTTDATSADQLTSVTGYYIPNLQELADYRSFFETGDYFLNQMDYNLKGWSASQDGELLTEQELNDLPENSHLYARYVKSIDVCLTNLNGAVYNTSGYECTGLRKIDEGMTIQQLNDMFYGTWDMWHAFVGWNTDPNATESLDPTSKVTTYSSYYAIFKNREFTELKVGETVDATFAAGEEKWFKVDTDPDAEGELLYLVYVQAPNTDIMLNVYDDEEERMEEGFKPLGDILETKASPIFTPGKTYYIQVKADQACGAVIGVDTQIVVTLDPNGGKISSSQIDEVEAFDVYTGKHRPLIDLTKTYTITPPAGHTFLGWATVKSSHTLVDVNKVLPVAGKTYYAVYGGTHTYGSYVTTKAATALATGSKYRICSVCHYKQTVAIPKLTPVAKFNVTSLPMQTGQTCKKVSLTMAKGDYIKSAWKSSNTAIVKVSGAYGTTTANKAVACTLVAQAKTGTATISVTLASGKVGKFTVTVQSGKVATTKAKLTSPTPTNSAGTQGAVTVVKNNYTAIKVTRVAPFTANDVLKFSTSDATIATVTTTGVVKGAKNGTAKITVRSSAGTWLAAVTVTVKSSIALNASSLLMQKLQVFKGLKVAMQTGDYVTSWKSSNTAVFKVTGGVGSTDGKLGTCTITAMAPAAASTYAYLTVTLHSGLSKKIKVTVQSGKVATTDLKLTAPKPLANASTKGAVTMSRSKTYTIKVTRTPISTTDTLKFTSSNTAVATVTSAGVVKAIKAGNATITVTSGLKKVYVSVKVQ